jgi:acyl carrier protein
VNADAVRRLMNECLVRQRKAPIASDGQTLRELGFRSLDFSEVALRVEEQVGRELDFDAGLLRSIETVGDVIAFFQNAAA